MYIFQMILKVGKDEILYSGYNKPFSSYRFNKVTTSNKSLCKNLGIKFSDFYFSQTVAKKIFCLARFWRKKNQQLFAPKYGGLKVLLFCTFFGPIVEKIIFIWVFQASRDSDRILCFERKLKKHLQCLYYMSMSNERTFFKLIFRLINVDCSNYFNFNNMPTRVQGLKINVA